MNSPLIDLSPSLGLQNLTPSPSLMGEGEPEIQCVWLMSGSRFLSRKG